MEETVGNILLETNEFCHLEIISNQTMCKETKNVSITAEEIVENPEYVVMCRSIAVQTFSNEEILIPKHDLSPNQRPSFTVTNKEGGNTMEVDFSSQESAMDIASQESVSVKESTPEEPHACDHKPSVSLQEEILFSREDNVHKRELAVLEREEKLKIQEEDIAYRERTVIQMEEDIQERQEMLTQQEKQIIDHEMALKKRETAIQIRELESEGYEVTLRRSRNNANGYEPPKRIRRN